MRVIAAGSVAAALAALAFVSVGAQQSTTFKSGVNLLAVDALVVEHLGEPILGLTPSDFVVKINNQPRRVVSATLVRHTTADVAAQRLGEQAARANVMLYVMHMDNSFAEVLSPARAGSRDPAMTMRSLFNDSTVLAAGLENLASEAGGVYLPIKNGTGEPAFARVARETTAYYLLGVEPTASDWDGRKLMVKVKANAKDATVRVVREIIAK